jgi:hypothetical protein
MEDRPLADALRAACTAVALDIGGWNYKKKSKRPPAGGMNAKGHKTTQ